MQGTESDFQISAPSTSRRPTRGRPRITPHPTASLLLDTTVELLETVPVEGLTIQIILDRSGVSYGSLYHHYEDISDLIEQAIVHRYTRRLKESLEAVRGLLESSDAADFRQRSETLFALSIAPERRKNRLERIEALGALHGRPRLVERIAQAQQDVTDSQAEILRELQSRGWLTSKEDPHVLSAFLQAMTVGRIVDDVSAHPIDRDRWNRVAILAFRAILFAD